MSISPRRQKKGKATLKDMGMDIPNNAQRQQEKIPATLRFREIPRLITLGNSMMPLADCY
jgi:hypothetical protein